MTEQDTDLFKSISKDLPNTPADVIDIWLYPLAKNAGWPPVHQSRWRNILRPPRNLDYLKRLTWTLEEIKISPQSLVPEDLQITLGLYQSYILKQPTLFSTFMTDGAERFERAATYLNENGAFPRPIILEQAQNKRYDVLDGAHRLTAFFCLYGYFTTPNDDRLSLKVTDNQTAWVSRLNV